MIVLYFFLVNISPSFGKMDHPSLQMEQSGDIAVVGGERAKQGEEYFSNL